MSAGCSSYQCNALPDHVAENCTPKIKGGGKHAYIIGCNSTITDYNDNAQIQAAVTAGDAVLLKNVLIDVAEGSPQAAGASYVAGSTPGINTYDYTVNIMDGNASVANDAFWAGINATTGVEAKAMLIKNSDDTNTLGVLVEAESGIKFVGGPIFPQGDNDQYHYKFAGQFRHTTGPKLQDISNVVW